MLKYKKILVTGLGRSGTSAVASTLKNLGYYMGYGHFKPTIEDPLLRKYLSNGDVESLCEELNNRAEIHQLVAYKDPKLFSSFGEQLFDLLDKDWLYVFVFRDPLSIAMRNESSMSRELNDAIRDAIHHQSKLYNFIVKVRDKNPVYLISYEKYLSIYKGNISEFLEFLGFQSGYGDIELLKKKIYRDQDLYRSV